MIANRNDSLEMLIEGSSDIVKQMNVFLKDPNETTLLLLHEEVIKFCTMEIKRLSGANPEPIELGDIITHLMDFIITRITKNEVSRLRYSALKEEIRLFRNIIKSSTLHEGISPDRDKGTLTDLNMKLVEFLFSLDTTQRIDLVLYLYLNKDKECLRLLKDKVLLQLKRLIEFTGTELGEVPTVNRVGVMRTLFLLTELGLISVESKFLFIFIGPHNFSLLCALNSVLKLDMNIPSLSKLTKIINKFYTASIEELIKYKPTFINNYNDSVQEFMLNSYTDNLFSNIDFFFQNINKEDATNIDTLRKLDNTIKVLKDTVSLLAMVK